MSLAIRAVFTLGVACLLSAAAGQVTRNESGEITAIKGRVTDILFYSIPNVLVVLTLTDSDQPIKSVRTDQHGEFALAVPSGAYDLHFETQGFLPVKMSLEKFVATGTVAMNVGPIREAPVRPSFWMAGRLVDSTKAPIKRATVSLTGPESLPDVKVDQDGTFIFDATTPGLYNLSFRAPGFKPMTIHVTQLATAMNLDIGPIVMSVGVGDINGDQVEPLVNGPIKTTLCELVKNPKGFDGKWVQLRVIVASGPDVPPGLYDRNCPPNNLLHVDRSNMTLIKSRGYKDLQMYLRWTTPIEASLTGIFLNKKVRDGFNTFDSTFELESISDVSVRTRKEVFQPADRSTRKK